MSGDEIGVEMSQEYMFDRQRMFGGKRNVLVGIALRVNDSGGGALLVADEVRRVRQAWQVELLEDQGAPTSRGRYVGWGTIRR
jgi:hypothetical protein